MSSALAHRYDSGMTNRAKIAITLRPDQVEAARCAVADGRAASVSAYVAEALDGYWHGDNSLDALLTELTEQNGPPSAEDYEWARQALDR